MTPEFILKLREKIGHDPLWLPGVTAIILNDDRVLLVQRSDTLAWTPVTGICDPGEQPDDAVRREAFEETGIRVRVDKLLWVSAVGPVTYPHGDVASYMDTAFLCSTDEPERTRVNDDENVDARWFHVKHLPDMKPRFTALVEAAIHGKQGWGCFDGESEPR